MSRLWQNDAYSTVAVGVAAVDTTIIVATGTGDRFPVVASPNYAMVTLKNAAGAVEIVKITNRTLGSDSLTVVRAQEGTSALTWNIGDIVSLRPTAAAFTAYEAHQTTVSGTHGVTGNIVGTSDAQTLTNKTLTTPVLSSTASGNAAGSLGYSGGLMSYGNGTVQKTLVTTDDTQTLTNKTIDNPTITTNVTLSGVSQRVTADFSNATLASRAAFETSTVNGSTSILALPNGTAVSAEFNACNNATPTNGSVAAVGVSGAEAYLSSTRNGSGAYLPLSVYVGGALRFQVGTSGQLGIGATPTFGNTGQLLVSQGPNAAPAWLDPQSPVSMIGYFAANSIPSGWLKANGAAVSRTTYAALFTAIGTLYGAGDGLTTFNLPDLRGEFLRGFDDARGADPGRTFGSWQAQDLMSHTHQINAVYSPSGLTSYASFAGAFSEGGNPWRNNAISTVGGETRPRNLAMLACIKYT